MTLNKRIEEIKIYYFGRKRGSHKKFIEKLDVASNTASNWMTDGYNVGKTVTDRLLEAFPDVSAGWLLTGEGNMLKGDNTPVESVPQTDDTSSNTEAWYRSKIDQLIENNTQLADANAKLAQVIASTNNTRRLIKN
ncbi:hypothetical protein JGH11_16350 [Dysgonomonas sp. Marseille-P4677]|nr:hypothetical protein [Dysgonomonas sp. Marseille-P4677]